MSVLRSPAPEQASLGTSHVASKAGVLWSWLKSMKKDKRVEVRLINLLSTGNGIILAAQIQPLSTGSGLARAMLDVRVLKARSLTSGVSRFRLLDAGDWRKVALRGPVRVM